MRFAAPQLLWLLLILVPALSAFLWWAWRRRQQLITQFISPRLLAILKVGVSPRRQKARLVITVLAVIFIILALARPQWGVTREEARQIGLDIVVAIDTSNSMLAEDVSPNRLARAKLAALDLMHRARADRLGLVAFAGAAFLQCPLTLDDAVFSESVNALDTKTISQGGTAIAEAINEARKAFKNESDNHKVLVLFTDGEDHDSDALEAAERAAKEGMIIFTIGIGTAEGELLRIRDDKGRLDYIRDEQGQPVKSKLNEELLQQIAQATKGFYVPLRGTKTIDMVYDRGLAPLPKSEKAVKMFQHYNERFQWFLAIAMALLILEMFLPERKRRSGKSSSAAPAALSNALAETVAVLFLVALLPMAARGSAGSAFREYNDGDYPAALKDYNKLLESKKDDPRLHFNAGAAAYQSRQLDEASHEFSEALASPDLQLQQRSYYNLGNTMYRIGEQMTEADKKKEAWENAIKGYESALKLNPQDGDAKFNHEFVKKQLEELKKQQSQSQKSDKNDKQDKKDQDKQNQDQKDQKQQDQKNDQSQSQKNDDKDKSGQNSQADNKVKEKSDEQKQQEQKEREQQQASEKKEDAEQKKQEAEKQAERQKEQSSEEAKKEAAMMAAGQMTPKQAQQMLDANKDDERVFQLAPPNKNVSQSPTFKNW